MAQALLKVTAINNARLKDGEQPYKLNDGDGLFLYVQRRAKTWLFQYRIGGKRGEITIGRFPEISLAEACEQSQRFRTMVAHGENPAQSKREAKRAARAAPQSETFKAFSLAWLDEKMSTKSETYRNQLRSFLERFVWDAIGAMPLPDVKSLHVRDMLEALRDIPITGEKVRLMLQQIFQYGNIKLLIETNPAASMRGLFELPQTEHHRHLNERELGAFWRALGRQHNAHPTTIAAARFLMLTMTRKNEVLRAKWSEVDFGAKSWTIPAERMKMRRAHVVYLSTQAIELLQDQHALTGRYEYVFPSAFNPRAPVAEATLNHLFGRLDFGVPEFAPHGTRSTAATLLGEYGYDEKVIDLLLAHKEKNKTKGAYQHQEHAGKRREALQFLADTVDRLAASNVVELDVTAA